TQPPPSIRALRPEIPAELDAVVSRMMALRPEDRYATPQEVMRALLPFLKPALRDHLVPQAGVAASAPLLELPSGLPANTTAHHILFVDDEPQMRQFVRVVLRADGLQCDDAANGRLALEALQAKSYDLVLLDVEMPEVTGFEVCRL